jgi:hypothetical protein
MPWHKIPHFPPPPLPSKMSIKYLYAMPIQVFYGGIYTKDLGYLKVGLSLFLSKIHHFRFFQFFSPKSRHIIIKNNTNRHNLTRAFVRFIN